MLRLPAMQRRLVRSRNTPRRAPPFPALRAPLQVTQLEDRVVPGVMNVISVTNGSDYGPLDTPITGSLRWAMEKAVDTYDQDYENWARLVIQDEVGGIGLERPLITGAIGLTTLEIITETPGELITITGDDNDFRFMNHYGNNGIDILLRDLEFMDFGTTGNGGVISTVAPLTLEGCEFEGNEAGGNGGAIYCEYTLDVVDCLFDSNEADGDGGAIYSSPSETTAGITITDSVFQLNTAGDDGGALYFSTVAGLLGIYDQTLFFDNYAGDDGGAVYMSGGETEIITDISEPKGAGMFGFWFNTAGGSASDLYLTELEAAHIEADFVAGSSGDGAAVYLYSTIPPSAHTYWSYIDFERVYTGDVDSNWPLTP